MPGEARSPLTPDPATSTPLEGVDGASSPDDQPAGAPEGATRHTPADSPQKAEPAADEGRPSSRRRRRLFALLAIVAVTAYVTDQVSKAAALNALADGLPRPFIGDVIRLKLIGNPGAALSLGAGNTWVMTAIAVGVLVAIVFVAKGLGSRAWAIALGLLLGAALGNLTDRFVRPPGGGQGHVVDFLDYNRWFIGNVADIWIVSAAVLIVLLALLGIGVDGRRDRDVRAAKAESERAGAGSEDGGDRA
ncbi:MAG TPA: signal peptidase II [Humibacillus xanthopallidus]|nr:signal peptidase II [Humibacillus xanthopallidus]